MGALIQFLMDKYIYFIFTAILLILALIGYVVDSKRSKNKEELTKQEENGTIDIPLPNQNVKIADAMNKNNLNGNMNNDNTTPPVAMKEVTTGNDEIIL